MRACVRTQHMPTSEASLQARLFNIEKLKGESTDAVFRAKTTLWERSEVAWPTENGDTSLFKPIVAGLELDPERIRSISDPDLQLDLMGPKTDPKFSFVRNDYGKQLQRMYLQMRRPSKFRNYIGTPSVLSGWQYPNGRSNTILDELISLTSSHGYETVSYGNSDEWTDRIGYRVVIPRDSDRTTLAFSKADIESRFENAKSASDSAASTASKLFADEESWRKSGVQYSYEFEVRVHPLLTQPPAKGESVKTVKYYRDANLPIYAPDDKWFDDLDLTERVDSTLVTVDQSACLESIYSCVAGRVGCGVPVVSMGPHFVADQWRLTSLRVLPDKHLYQQLFETQNFLEENSFFLESSEVSRNRQEAATQLFMARVCSFQTCIEKLAQVGFLHLGLSGVNMLQGTIFKPGIGSEGDCRAQGGLHFNGAGATYVRDFRPRSVALVRLPSETCSVIMRTILILDLYARDSKRNLLLLDNISSILTQQIFNLIATKKANTHVDHFYKLLVQCWKSLYFDAREYKLINADSNSQIMLQPSPISKKPSPPEPIKPSSTPQPPTPIVSRFQMKVSAPSPVPPVPPTHSVPEPRKPSGKGSGFVLNTNRNANLFTDLLNQTNSSTAVPKREEEKGEDDDDNEEAELKRVEDEFIKTMTSLEDAKVAATRKQTNDEMKEAMRRRSASVGLYSGPEFIVQVNRVQAKLESGPNGWKPPRDSLVLALRLTHRLYGLVRRIAFVHASEQAKLDPSSVPDEFKKGSEEELLPSTVRMFCDEENTVTDSALELAALCLSKYAREAD